MQVRWHAFCCSGKENYALYDASRIDKNQDKAEMVRAVAQMEVGEVLRVKKI